MVVSSLGVIGFGLMVEDSRDSAVPVITIHSFDSVSCGDLTLCLLSEASRDLNSSILHLLHEVRFWIFGGPLVWAIIQG